MVYATNQPVGLASATPGSYPNMTKMFLSMGRTEIEEHDFMRVVQRLNYSTSVLVRDNIENFFMYEYDGGANAIQDGGADMYDTGNSVSEAACLIG